MKDAEINPTTDAPEQIRKERERLQNTLNAAGVGTWRWDFQNNRFTADPLLISFFDVMPDPDNPGDPAPFVARTHPDDLAGIQAALAESVATRKKYSHIYRTVHRDGSIHWLDGRGRLDFDDEGNPTALIGTVMDITEFKNTQEAVRVSEEKYRRLIENVDQGYCLCEIIFDENGRGIDHRYLEVNPAFETMTGLANAAGKSACEMVPNIEDWWHEKYAEVVRSGESVRFQHGSEAMGMIFDIFASAAGGSRVAILFTNVTEKVRRERESEALNERLRRAMAETHHRVKNNLQVISSLVEMQVSEMDKNAAIPLHRINQHVKALAAIHELLTKQAKADADMEHIGTRAIFETLMPLLQNTIGDRGIVATSDDILLTAQKAASFALLVNECVSNAIKHADAGQIDITLKRESDTARLEICDDGRGFPANFNPQKAANTGLQLIESAARWDLRGEVHYDNHGLGGGRVTVTFPIDAPHPLPSSANQI